MIIFFSIIILNERKETKMTNIIKVTKNEIGNAELNSVNARDIHNYLQVNSKFADWIKRAISKYDFKENVDYLLAIPKMGTVESSRISNI